MRITFHSVCDISFMIVCMMLTMQDPNLVDCAEAYATEGGQHVMETSDYYDSNQTFNVYDQEGTLTGKEYESKTEKCHSGIPNSLTSCSHADMHQS